MLQNFTSLSWLRCFDDTPVEYLTDRGLRSSIWHALGHMRESCCRVALVKLRAGDEEEDRTCVTRRESTAAEMGLRKETREKGEECVRSLIRE